jgi:phage shock protein PspC (stress-responsive transcriptional regulator)
MPATLFSEPIYDRTEAPDQHRVEGLRRPIEERVFGGVSAAMAGWLSIDVRAVRIAFIVLAVLSGTAVPLYAAGWLLIPAEGSALSIGQELARTLRPH